MRKERLSAVNVIEQASVAPTIEALRRQGVYVVELRGDEVVDLDSFLRQTAVDLPQPRATSPPATLSALSDNLWQGLHGLKQAEVAVVWSHVEQLSDRDLGMFLWLTQLFGDLSREVARSPQPFSLYLVVAGEGRAFRSSRTASDGS